MEDKIVPPSNQGEAKIRITAQGKVVDEIRTRFIPIVPNGSLVAFVYKGVMFKAGHVMTKKGHEDYFVAEIGDSIE